MFPHLFPRLNVATLETRQRSLTANYAAVVQEAVPRACKVGRDFLLSLRKVADLHRPKHGLYRASLGSLLHRHLPP